MGGWGGWADGWVGGRVGGWVGGWAGWWVQVPMSGLAHPQWTMVGGGCFFLTGAGLNAGAHSLVGG